MDLSDLQDDGLCLARGRYATLTSERRRLLKSMAEHATIILKAVIFVQQASQSDESDTPEMERRAFAAEREINKMIAALPDLHSLDEQRAELKDIAWPK